MPPLYTIGIMTMQIDERRNQVFVETVSAASKSFEKRLLDLLPIDVKTLTLTGQHFVPTSGAYAPLDFMEVAISEKVERDLSFLIIVTDVELASASKSYLMAMSSQATNIGLITTKRLQPTDESGNPHGEDRVCTRLTTLLLRTFGRLLNLPVADGPRNIMSPLIDAARLDQLDDLNENQIAKMVTALPQEALDRSTTRNKTQFIIDTIRRQFTSILRIAWQAHPFRLLSKLPTMLATALSVIVVLLFGAETWDFSAAASPAQIMLFTAVAFSASTFLLYRSFSLPTVTSRSGALSESVVVTAVATLVALFLALLTMFLMLSTVMFLGAEFVFPDSLKKTWTTVQDGSQLSAHIKLSVFLAAIGVLSGSLGGAADNRALVRSVLFVSEDD